MFERKRDDGPERRREPRLHGSEALGLEEARARGVLPQHGDVQMGSHELRNAIGAGCLARGDAVLGSAARVTTQIRQWRRQAAS